MLRNFLLSAFFVVLTAVGGVLSVPLPPVPFTMQTFFVVMSGLLLGPKYGPLSQLVYIILGLAGAPIFAGGAGGLHHVFSPSFGFLAGFIPMSWVAGLLVSSTKTVWENSPIQKTAKYTLISFAATAALYAIGLPFLYFNMRYIMQTPMSAARVIEVSCLPFIIPDSIKAVVAGGLAAQTISVLRGADLLPS